MYRVRAAAAAPAAADTDLLLLYVSLSLILLHMRPHTLTEKRTRRRLQLLLKPTSSATSFPIQVRHRYVFRILLHMCPSYYYYTRYRYGRTRSQPFFLGYMRYARTSTVGVIRSKERLFGALSAHIVHKIQSTSSSY